VAWADRIAYVCHDFEDAVRAGILTPDDLPAGVRDVAGERASQQVGVFVGAVLDAIDRTGHVGMTEPAASVLDAFRSFNFERIYLRPAARRQAERVIRLLRGLVEHFADAPVRIPDGSALQVAAASPEAAAAAVRYVSGMTDRYALGLGVELLGWPIDQLPRGV
jgi:dGTPase